eukprot:scaffold665_cov101-Isochrysis_galbana.AAC.1
MIKLRLPPGVVVPEIGLGQRREGGFGYGPVLPVGAGRLVELDAPQGAGGARAEEGEGGGQKDGAGGCADGERGGRPAGRRGDADQLVLQRDGGACGLQRADHGADRSVIPCRQTRARVDNAAEGCRIVEKEGLGHVQLGRRAAGLVAQGGQLQPLQDQVAGQVHVGRETVRADVQRQLPIAQLRKGEARSKSGRAGRAARGGGPAGTRRGLAVSTCRRRAGATHVKLVPDGVRAAADAIRRLKQAEPAGVVGGLVEPAVGEVDSAPAAANDNLRAV